MIQQLAWRAAESRTDFVYSVEAGIVLRSRRNGFEGRSREASPRRENFVRDPLARAATVPIHCRA